MANEWEEYDREQQRQNELQQQIQWLADWEEKLMENVRPMLNEPPSPLKAQSGYESAREQKKFVEELTRLEKIPVSDDELNEQWERLPEYQKMAAEATELLAKHRMEEALPKQQQVLDYLRSLLKQEQNQDSQNQEQNEQDQQNSENQEQSQEENEQQDNKNSSAMNQQDKAMQPEESPEEKAERQLIQVRRKEQEAKERREQVRALLMQADPVAKDW
jgi:Ca-activated chloride channel family protein